MLTTGRHPFKAQTPAETVRRICFSGPPTLPSKIAASYPGALEKVVMKALSSERNDRYATAAELAEELVRARPDLAEDRMQAGYLRELLADCIASRRSALDEAIETAETKRRARNAPTVPPPRSRPSSSGTEQTLLEIPKDGEFSANTFSSLRALILSSASNVGAPAAGDGSEIQPIPAANVRRGAALAAMAAVFAAAIALSLGMTSGPAASAKEARTSADAPLRLVERTLAALRAKSADSGQPESSD